MAETKVTSASADNTGTTIRTAIVWLAGMLLSRQLISEEFYQQFMSGIPFIVGLLMLLVPWVQSYWSKWRGRQKTEQAVDVALALPVTATKADVVAKIDKLPDLPMLPKITGSGSTPLPMILVIVLAAVLVGSALTSTSCAHNSSGQPVVVGTSMSQSDAKRALIAIQDTRTAALKLMAAAYMAAPGNPKVIDAALTVDAYDRQVQSAWAYAAKAVDQWDVEAFLTWYWQAKNSADAMGATAREVK